MKKYSVRFSTREGGWEGSGQEFTSLKEARAEYQHQLEMDEKEGWTDNCTQIIDENENVIEEHFGEDY